MGSASGRGGKFDRASAGGVRVLVKPHGVREAFRGCCGGFTRSVPTLGSEQV
jgi:hypothetical protein